MAGFTRASRLLSSLPVGALLLVTPSARAGGDPESPNRAPPVASSGADAPRRFEVALQLGVSLPMGTREGAALIELDGQEHYIPNQPMAELYAMRVPLTLVLGYRVAARVVLGAVVQYGFITDKATSPTCVSGRACSDHDVTVGLQAVLQLAPTSFTDPWVGLGVGYEFLDWSATDKLEWTTYSGSYDGPVLNLQGGLDLEVGNALAAGPFFGISLGELTGETNDNPYDQQTTRFAVPNATLHEWLTLGVKGSFGFGG